MSEMIKREDAGIVANDEEQVIYGFEETKEDDFLVPRLKVINALSPERVDGLAEEGDVINSLTHESVAGKRFIPLKQYYSNIWWNADRNAEERIICRSLDGRIGDGAEGVLACAQCKKNQWDNTKQGKEAQPICTSYLNFVGIFEDAPMPVILSFAKTNYNEGRKMLSIARSLRSSIFNYGYTLQGKKITKDRNTWYNIEISLAGETSPEVRALAKELYKSVDLTQINTNYDEGTQVKPVTDEQTEAEIS